MSSRDYYHNRTSEQFLADYERETKGFNIHSVGRRTCGKQEGHDEECGDEDCTDEAHEHEHSEECDDSESYFSWSPCDTCGSTLGGDRTPCVLTNAGTVRGEDGIVRRHETIEVESCVDCVMFAANGDLPGGNDDA